MATILVIFFDRVYRPHSQNAKRTHVSIDLFFLPDEICHDRLCTKLKTTKRFVRFILSNINC